MAQFNLTVIGLENYLQQYGKSLFSGVTFPAGIDKETAVNNILMESGEFEVLYADPDFMTEAITLWCNSRYHDFEKWLEGLNASFSPIENYDRYEEYKDTEGTSGNATGSSTSSSTDLTDVSAYDSSGYQPKDKLTSSGSSTTGTNTTSSRTLDHESHIHGNIGITQATDMVKNFLGLYQNNNIYQMIAGDFITRFTIMVY